MQPPHFPDKASNLQAGETMYPRSHGQLMGASLSAEVLLAIETGVSVCPLQEARGKGNDR